MKFFTKIKSRGITILVSILFLASVVLLNIFTGMLTQRFFLRIDLTETGIYTLSERAADFVGGIDEPVDIIVLAEESSWRAGNAYEMLINILNNYSASSGGYIKVQYVNPDLNSFNGPAYNNSLATLKSSYNELDDMSRNDIIVLSQRRAALISFMDMFSHGIDGSGRQGISGLRTDQELISALTYVLNEDIARIVFINNHQENSTEFISVIFERSGYVSSSINLIFDDIPDNTTVLVSAAPKFDFLNEEIKKLEEYLMLGGVFIYLYDPQLPSLPLFDNFLAEWGVTVENKIIFDEDYTIPQLGVIAAHVVSGPLPSTVNAEVLTRNVIPMGAFLPRPLRAEETRGDFLLMPLISTFSSSSYTKDINDGNITTTERESGDDQGPFTIAYNIRRMTRNADGLQVYANLIVVGANLFEDAFLGMYGESFYNPVLIADMANDFNPYGERVFIAPKDFGSNQMLVSSAGTRTIFIALVVVLPLLILAAGVYVWLKRRHQ